MCYVRTERVGEAQTGLWRSLALKETKITSVLFHFFVNYQNTTVCPGGSNPFHIVSY